MNERRINLWLLVLALFSWLGWITLIRYTAPNPVTQVAFFGLLFAASASVAGLLASVLNRHLVKARILPADLWRPLREGVLIGMVVVLAGWLRMRQALGWGEAFLLLAAALCLEVLILVRKGSR